MYSLILILLLIFLGYGLSVILLPAKIKKFSLILSPFIGTIMIIVIGLALSVAKLGINQSLFTRQELTALKGYHLIIFFVFLTWIYAFIFHKKILLRFYKHNLFYIPFVLILLVTGILNFPDQSDLLNISTKLQNDSLFGLVQDSGYSLSKVPIQIGTPILYSFLLSVFLWIPKNEFLQSMYISYILTFGIFALVLLLIINIRQSLKLFEFNGSIVLTSAAIFSLSALNTTVFFFALVVMGVCFLYLSYLHRTLQYIYTFLKIILLWVLINPFFTGLLIQKYLFS